MTIEGLDTPAMVHKGGMTLTGSDGKMVGHCLLQFLWSSVVHCNGRSRPSDKWGPGHPDPEIRGGPVSQKIFSGPLASFWLTNK